MKRLFILPLVFFSIQGATKPIVSFNGFKWDTHISTIKKAHKSYQELGLERDFRGYFLSYDFDKLKGESEYLGDYPLKSKTFYFKDNCKNDTAKCFLNTGIYTLANPANIDLNKLINKYKSVYKYIGATEQPHSYKLAGVKHLPGRKDRYVFEGDYGGAVIIETLTPDRDDTDILTSKKYYKGVIEDIYIKYLDRNTGLPHLKSLKKLLRNTKSINKVNDF